MLVKVYDFLYHFCLSLLILISAPPPPKNGANSYKVQNVRLKNPQEHALCNIGTLFLAANWWYWELEALSGAEIHPYCSIVLYSWASRAFRTNAQNLFLLPKLNSTDLMYPYGTVWGFTMTPGHAAANFMIVGGWNGGSRTNSPFHADSIKMTYRLRFCMSSPGKNWFSSFNSLALANIFNKTDAVRDIQQIMAGLLLFCITHAHSNQYWHTNLVVVALICPGLWL